MAEAEAEMDRRLALDPDRPVLIAGPTAAGKSALALAIAQRIGGVVVNADALQVFACWRVLTARPDPEDDRRGHRDEQQQEGVGQQLRRARADQVLEGAGGRAAEAVRGHDHERQHRDDRDEDRRGHHEVPRGCWHRSSAG